MGDHEEPTPDEPRPEGEGTGPELPFPPPPPDIPELLQRPAPKGNPRVGQPTPIRPDMMGQWGRVFVIGTNFAAAVIGFSLIGYFLDRWLGLAPWLLLTGVALGLISGFLGFVREARRLGSTPPRR